MNVALKSTWTPDKFLHWAGAQDGRYEFDGVRPVAMVAGTGNHDRITQNISIALRLRLRGSPCLNFGPTMSIRTIQQRVRNPDAFITCTKFPGTAMHAPNPVIVFEVLSPSSGHIDRIEKASEYQSVASILRYVIVESVGIGLQVLHRERGGQEWTFAPLKNGDTLDLPEVGIDVPVIAFYEDIVFENDDTS